MLTKTIGQLSATSTIDTADYLETESAGASRKATLGSVGTYIVNTDRPYATSAESAAGSSATAVLTPTTLRAALNAENPAPIYACRAWVNFDGTTASSSITATYSRASASNTVVVVATAHGCISGNVQYLDFTSGTASDNTYVVTYIDADSFSVTTVSTSSTLGNVSIKRSPIFGAGNVGSIAYIGVGVYWINFSIALPSENYGVSMLCHGAVYGISAGGTPNPTMYAFNVAPLTVAGGAAAPSHVSVSVFA